MLIVSKFHDYYDGVASMGIDKTVVYKREHTELSLKNFIVEASSRTYYRSQVIHDFTIEGDIINLEGFVIGFCGNLYIGLVKRVLPFGWDYMTPKVDPEVIYGEDILKLPYMQRNKRDRWNDEEFKKQVEHLVNRYHGKEDMSLFRQHHVPIFHQDLHFLERREHVLYLNPELKPFQFAKVKDAYTAFQEISGFISGVLGMGDKPLVELSNNDRIIKAGFDTKTSFRKDKKP